MATAQYTHARNSHPAPPITITVDRGVIVSLLITREVVENYTSGAITSLFEAAGVGSGRILFPIPARFSKVPLRLIKFSLIPGEYEVRHTGEYITLPESAYSFSIGT